VATCLALWSVIQQRVYETRVHDIVELRQRLLHVWRGLEQSLIDNAVDRWQTRLRACVHASGGYFDYILCDYQFVFSVFDELCFTPCLMQRAIFKECIIKV